ncbi:sodium:proton antiporter [Gilliamella sp. Choc4-2]|jgi:Na+/H+ antiporter NhaD/arsenite permease-like protein|uniref:sodium:proton antiporter n=1 Tax=unclassified Gilliamella TaxID=2685620 RepID=UPI0004DD0AFD|nr:sodium:proton antiporter [Gilliamella apicola]KFA59385.1 putative transmembrane protein [Gilliamella apicola]OCG32003.1 sodium:proton antiporter [Gilliamella apicola]OCG45076.1 sodium:proton antiporter [Gilliamella apicola]OCG54648.1 sodium:proton antiporter [Gilliamella apicola]OCG65109.1 sodium:proton antiporter [Gilliamella apicola]
MKHFITLSLIPILIFTPFDLYADDFSQHHFSLIWCIPFAGTLISIALLPLITPRIWHHHYGKIIIFWVLLFMISAFYCFGYQTTIEMITHAILAEYIPFILLLMALFTVSGGIFIKSEIISTPELNVSLLAIGTLLASIMGTTGAAMVMIRPLIRANRNRKQAVHIIIFFIFLVANIGGGLTPLGDPPLFIGFLKGIDFFWTVKNMLLPVLLSSLLLLTIFYFIDRYYFQLQYNSIKLITIIKTNKSIKLYGIKNIFLLAMIITMVLLSGLWQTSLGITILDTHLSLSSLIRDIFFIIITITSTFITSKSIRASNDFNWEPIVEVAKLFLGIFITIVPVLAILRAGNNGALSSLVSLVNNQQGQPINSMYFWFSGLLSSFLDNAPTYLVFFNLASGNAVTLMTTLEKTLLAISIGSVFMGALSYIGNAPNLMVKSIAIQNKINMPSFFGYMKWSIGILTPVFAINNLLFFL